MLRVDAQDVLKVSNNSDGTVTEAAAFVEGTEHSLAEVPPHSLMRIILQSKPETPAERDTHSGPRVTIGLAGISGTINFEESSIEDIPVVLTFRDAAGQRWRRANGRLKRLRQDQRTG